MTTHGERFREHLGRLAGHVVREYKKVVGPKPLYQQSQNKKGKTNNARQYIQKLSVENLTKLLTPKQLQDFNAYMKRKNSAGRAVANRIKNLTSNSARVGMYPRNLNGKLSDNSLSKLKVLGLEPSSSLILSQLNGPRNGFGNTRNPATMVQIINKLYNEHLNKKNKNARKLSNLKTRINTNGRLNTRRAKDIALYLHGLSNKVVNGINKTTLNSAKAKKTRSTSGNPQIPNANGNLLYNIYLQEALNLNKKPINLKEIAV